MSSGSSSRSGAKPMALPPSIALRPSTKGSSMMPRNWFVSWNAPLLRAGRRLAREQRERVGEIGAGEPEDRHERGRQRAAVVEERVERIGDVALVGPRVPDWHSGRGDNPTDRAEVITLF